jgi:hypothetical protein
MLMVRGLNFVLIAAVVAGALYRLVMLTPALNMQAVGSPLDSLHDLPPIHSIEVTADRLTLRGPNNESLLSIDPASFDAVGISQWDAEAPVFVTAGRDGQPGVALVDDDGNGVVDDRLELGATQSDDEMLTPDGPGYPQAENGSVVAMTLSRGAMRAVEKNGVIEGPTQVWIDIVDGDRLVSRLIDLL